MSKVSLMELGVWKELYNRGHWTMDIGDWYNEKEELCQLQ